MTDTATFEERVLAAADALFYAHGVNAVGMDRIRDAAGVTLRRLYQCFPSKGALVEAVLRRRDTHYRAALTEFVTNAAREPRQRVLAVFDWMHGWCEQPGFRGCAFLNAFGELGAGSEGVARAVRDSKNALRRYLRQLASEAGVRDPEPVADQLLLLFDGAASVAAVRNCPEAARHARAAAEALLDAHGSPA
ncbi:TetR/AcrR family transcriptional regulator [Streptomyces sp. HNM0574]|uniref:TetR/AcrR family transcriptional regulator n=1 Tax=Streptomyces sp. HNM0574 TaxID=2714954 RepID=UPI00146D6039|nr:TetR/AcrR family transcriptional regulator [Streptomyces sp. HNM0574]NLU68933.1 TetR/AcrR family transcriptional regulator [Streptomyces sp. HNM0574]